MVSTYVNNLRLEEMATGEKSGTWGGITNTTLELVGQALGYGTRAIANASTDNITIADGASDADRSMYLKLTGGGQTCTVTLLPNTSSKMWIMENATSYTLTFTQGSGANVAIPAGQTKQIFADGLGSGAVVYELGTLAVGGVQSNGAVTVGVDDTGHDVTFFGATAGKKMLWDESADALIVTGDGTFQGLDLAAFSGVIQTNANFVDQVIFGPSVDGVAWNGAWSKASVYSSLMLATIEDEGSNTEINIWDLTTPSNTTPLATVDLSAAATPTSIAASMGYIIVGSEDGIAIIDPHSGAWAERTIGWPRTLSTSSAPALDSNDVVMVAAAVAGVSPLDPRTGGLLPAFACLYASGESKTASLIKTDGNVWDITGTAPVPGVIGFQDGDIIFPRDDDDTRRFEVELINADFASSSGDSYWGAGWPYTGFASKSAFSASGIHSAAGSNTGVVFRLRGDNIYTTGIASINRTYNTGYLVGDIRGAWLANSKTVDRSPKANTLTENGTVTEGAVESGAELNGYSGFSTSNYLSRASDADWDSLGTGAFYVSIWAKTSGNSAKEAYVTWSNAGQTVEVRVHLDTGGNIDVLVDGATTQTGITGTRVIDDGAWHKIDLVNVSSTERYLYIDGTIEGSNTTDSGSISDSGNMPLRIGLTTPGTSFPATSSTLSLARLSTYAPPASLIRQMYDGEKGMFAASAECLLQSGSTDAVIDVSVDPLSKKVLVTQTDAITVFDGLVVDSKPTVNSGASEKGKLWGALRAEQNSANAYVTAPATDQRQVNEMVRGLASDLPAGVDLSKAKAWVVDTGKTGSTIAASFNIKSGTYDATGIYTYVFAVPFKTDDYVVSVVADGDNTFGIVNSKTRLQCTVKFRDHANADTNSRLSAVFFGELENE